MVRFVKTILYAVFFLVLVEVVVLLVFTFFRDDQGFIRFGGRYLFPVVDDRMNPYISKGDMVEVMKLESKQILANSVIAYLDSKQIVRLGRVSSIESNEDSSQFVLTFDGEDATVTIDSSAVLGLWSTTKIPFLGYFLSFLFSKDGILLGIVFPLFLLFMFEFGQLIFFLRKGSSQKKFQL